MRLFGKIAADALGLSDVGKVIKPQDFDKVDSDDYVMHEDGEKIYFIIKSRKDEYCFTNLGLIHLDGSSAVSKKRMLKRYTFAKHEISGVYMETAGTVDLDVEIKFSLGGEPFSIDVDKRQIEAIKDLYKALLKISDIIASNDNLFEYAKLSINIAKETMGRTSIQNASAVEQFSAINESAYNWLRTKHEELKIKDFGFVFEQYINQ